MEFINDNIGKWIAAGIGSIVAAVTPFIVRKWRRVIREKAERQKEELKSILFEFQQAITKKQDDIFSAIETTRQKLTEQYDGLNTAREENEKKYIELVGVLNGRIQLCEERHTPWDGVTERRRGK